jgi:hypothetical protein
MPTATLRFVVLALALAAACLFPPVDTAVAQELKVDGLPTEPQAFKTHVQQILSKADAMIKKLKDKEEARAVVLDLIQTRDNVLRELLKAEARPDGAKWTNKEGRESIEAMLRLLKAQYEKAASLS